jgi:hypothetical protein
VAESVVEGKGKKKGKLPKGKGKTPKGNGKAVKLTSGGAKLAGSIALIAAGIAVVAGTITWAIHQAKAAERALEKAKKTASEL